MGLFDKFRKKEAAQQPQALSQPADPAANTSVVIFFDRMDLEVREIEAAVSQRFGEAAVLSADNAHPAVTNLMLRIDGIDVMCSYLPFPFPKEECDLQSMLGVNHFISEEEQRALLDHKAFCLLTEIGGGKTLAGKRSVCLMLSKLCGSLLAIRGAAGVYCGNARLLLGRAVYQKHASISEREAQNPAYFPTPLWVLVYRTHADDGAPVIETCGLEQFGFLELQFYRPTEEWASSYEKLYILSTLQITGKELYQNRDTISFSQDAFSIFKQSGGKLSVIGGI